VLPGTKIDGLAINGMGGEGNFVGWSPPYEEDAPDVIAFSIDPTTSSLWVPKPNSLSFSIQDSMIINVYTS
jgi:hypothetical protein